MGSKQLLSVQDLDRFDDSYLLTPGEVAGIFRVDPKTVTRWAAKTPAKDGKPEKPPRMASIRTVGGHRRFRVGDVRQAVLDDLTSAE